MSELNFRKDSQGLFNPVLHFGLNPIQVQNQNFCGYYGQLWQKWMAEYSTSRMNILVMQGRWNEVALQVEEEAQERKERLNQEFIKEHPRPTGFQKVQAWEAERMLSIEHRIMTEVVYQNR